MTDTSDASLIDISIPFAAHMPAWPGDTPFSCGWTARRETGASVNLAHLHLSAHTGTHADAPLHVETAWGASETLSVAAFVGEARVIALSASHAADRAIDVTTLEQLLADSAWCARLLICTGVVVNRHAFPGAWPALDEPAARWLVQRGVRLVGVDAPSVDARDSTSLPVHHALFGSGAHVLENLALGAVPPGRYELLAPPLFIVGADAAPVRALLRKR